MNTDKLGLTLGSSSIGILISPIIAGFFFHVRQKSTSVDARNRLPVAQPVPKK